MPPTVLADTLALFADKKVAVLVYNEQTSSPETEQLLAAAQGQLDRRCRGHRDPAGG